MRQVNNCLCIKMWVPNNAITFKQSFECVRAAKTNQLHLKCYVTLHVKTLINIHKTDDGPTLNAVGNFVILHWTSTARECYISAIFRGIQRPLPPSLDTRINTCNIYITIQVGPWKLPQTSTKPYQTRLNHKLTSTYSIQSHEQDNHNL